MDPILYRFSGYQLPMIQLDETGPAYVILGPHPYYYDQPEEWQQPYYGPVVNPIVIDGVSARSSSNNQDLLSALSNMKKV